MVVFSGLRRIRRGVSRSQTYTMHRIEVSTYIHLAAQHVVITTNLKEEILLFSMEEEEEEEIPPVRIDPFGMQFSFLMRFFYSTASRQALALTSCCAKCFY